MRTSPHQKPQQRNLGRRLLAGALGACAFVGSLAATRPASAQARNFYLDRAQLSGAPDDGFMVWRTYMSERTRFYASGALGFTLNPLQDTVVTDNGGVQQDMENPVQTQTIAYLGAGAQVASRVGFNIMLPVVFQTLGADATALGVGNGSNASAVAVHDVRLDARVRTWESDDHRFRIGGAAALWLPTGNARSYASDGQTTGGLFGTAEFDFKKFLLAGMIGPHFRPDLSIPGDRAVLGITGETRFAGGAYLILREGRLRIGGELWGTTGLPGAENYRHEATFFKGRNTDFEWLGQFRFLLSQDQKVWFNAGGGTRISSGYGSPDVRILAQIGTYTPLGDAEPGQVVIRHKREAAVGDEKDTDGDGYPDSIDACPTVKEDGKDPDATDGCPAPADRDHDGLTDDIDKCPNDPEDFDKIEDNDGCPEEDADNDKIPDTEDHCPTDPGPRSKIAEKNGCPSLTHVSEDGTVEILEPIQFDTGKATIKSVSFPILDEVVVLLESRPEMRLGVYGHTDNKGVPANNLKLSKDRAASVMKYLIAKGISADRLESDGYGQTKPIADNGTNDGRQKNRRVEFKILSSD